MLVVADFCFAVEGFSRPTSTRGVGCQVRCRFFPMVALANESASFSPPSGRVALPRPILRRDISLVLIRVRSGQNRSSDHRHEGLRVIGKRLNDPLSRACADWAEGLGVTANGPWPMGLARRCERAGARPISLMVADGCGWTCTMGPHRPTPEGLRIRWKNFSLPICRSSSLSAFVS